MTLRLDQVVAGYGATTVLRGVSLVVPRGRVVALLGPNGAGKTTLLRACSGEVAISGGKVNLDSRDVTGLAPHQIARLGVCHIPEGRAVFPSLTVAENLRLMVNSGDQGGIDRAFDAFPVLGRKRRQLAGTMSGGEQQMLALSRMLLDGSSVVLLDEVSMGLAPKVVDELFDVIGHAIALSGAAVLIVEQYATKALGLADLVYVLDRGTVSFAGEPSELDADALAASYLAISDTKG